MRQAAIGTSSVMILAQVLTQTSAANSFFVASPDESATTVPAYPASPVPSRKQSHRLSRRGHNEISHHFRLQKRACKPLDVDCGNGFCCPLTFQCVLPDRGTSADTQCRFGDGAFPFQSLSPAYAENSATTSAKPSPSSTFTSISSSPTQPASTTSTAAASTPTLDGPMRPGGSVAAGAIAGITVGIIVLLALVAALIVSFFYKRKRRGHAELSSVNGDSTGHAGEPRSQSRHGAGSATIPLSPLPEKPLPPTLAQAPNFGPVQEMEAPPGPIEMEASSPRAEVMGDVPAQRKKRFMARWSRPVHEMQG